MTTKRKRVYPADKRYKITHGMLIDLRRIFINAARFQWSHDSITESITNHIQSGERWERLDTPSKEYVRGAIQILWDLHWEKVQFSYEFPKVGRLLISDPEYRKIPPSEVSLYWTHTGAFAYREPPHKLFTQPKGIDDDNQG